jgi:hypothetical protein
VGRGNIHSPTGGEARKRHILGGFVGTVGGVNLHDATLASIVFDWEPAEVRAIVHVWERGDVIIRASGVSRLEVPRTEPWGPSSSINQVKAASGRMEIEMQSGDTIVIDAASFELP